jgi:hypothetical protein
MRQLALVPIAALLTLAGATDSQSADRAAWRPVNVTTYVWTGKGVDLRGYWDIDPNTDDYATGGALRINVTSPSRTVSSVSVRATATCSYDDGFGHSDTRTKRYAFTTRVGKARILAPPRLSFGIPACSWPVTVGVEPARRTRHRVTVTLSERRLDKWPPEICTVSNTGRSCRPG